MSIFLIVLIILFTILSGFLSLAQISLFSLSSNEIKLYRADKDTRRQLIAKLLSRPRELLVTILMSDIAANILVQNFAANLFGQFASWWLKVGVPLALTLLLGEVIPKTLALSNNTKIAYAVSPTIDLLQKLLGPVRTFTTKITSQFSRVLFFFLKKEKDISKDELQHVLKTSERHGILSNEEAKIIDGYLSLTDYTVKERMQPRYEMLVYDLEEPLSKLLYLFVDKECSRVPVCQGDLQNLLGIISATVFFIHHNDIHHPTDLIKFLQKPYYVPETIHARSLLRKFLFTDQTIGIVLDEYGSVSGLITKEDLFEVVIGEIADSRDEKEPYTKAGENIIIASGKFELAQFEELFGVSLPSENNMVTLGGWLTEQLGDIPKSGTKFIWNQFLFQVLAADPTRVRRIYIRRLKQKSERIL